MKSVIIGLKMSRDPKFFNLYLPNYIRNSYHQNNWDFRELVSWEIGDPRMIASNMMLSGQTMRSLMEKYKL